MTKDDPANTSGDWTPTVGSATDIARVGRAAAKPRHEQTAAEDVDPADWDRVVRMPEFGEMLRAKVRFVVPATLFFVVYYFTLPLLVGYAPELMSRRILGVINLAYVFALSQFLMAWAVAALYLRAAAGFDKLEKRVIDKTLGGVDGGRE